MPPTQLADGPRRDGACITDDGAHSRPPTARMASPLCETMSIAAWLLEMIGILNCSCRTGIASIALQLVHERKTQSGAITNKTSDLGADFGAPVQVTADRSRAAAIIPTGGQLGAALEGSADGTLAAILAIAAIVALAFGGLVLINCHL